MTIVEKDKPLVAGFHDERTGSVQYVVACRRTGSCAIIDPVLDFDEKSGSIATRSADRLLAHVAASGFTIEWILDTHPHADHMSAAAYLKEKTGAKTAIGARVTDVQRIWTAIYGFADLPCDGSQWDRLFEPNDTFALGDLAGRILFSPGHTLASITYLIGDAAFIHDTLFMPDSGTARTDFPGGDPHALYASIQAILSLPDATRLYTGHDYRPSGRPALWESTVAEQRTKNAHLVGSPTAEEFVAIRRARDETLPMPRLILHALQVNIRGGRLPDLCPDGRRRLTFPLNALDGAAWS